MKRIFPMYKGVSLDKAGMGYSSIQSAKHYMDEKPIRKDFDKSLPKNYWYEFEYVYKHNGHVSGSCISEGDYQFHDTDYDEKFYIKDLTGKDKELWDKVYAIEDKYRERGWYYALFEDTKDYWKKYRAYKKANVEYVEKSVKIKVE